MTTGPGDHGRLRACHADREQVIGILQAAFAQGRLTPDELDARAGQAFAARTYADLAALTADIPPTRLRLRPADRGRQADHIRAQSGMPTTSRPRPPPPTGHGGSPPGKLRRSRGQLPPRPGPGGRALEGERRASTGHDPDPPHHPHRPGPRRPAGSSGRRTSRSTGPDTTRRDRLDEFGMPPPRTPASAATCAQGAARFQPAYAPRPSQAFQRPVSPDRRRSPGRARPRERAPRSAGRATPHSRRCRGRGVVMGRRRCRRRYLVSPRRGQLRTPSRAAVSWRNSASATSRKQVSARSRFISPVSPSGTPSGPARR